MMIVRWTLENFKSFKGRKSLAVAPLTLLCGANSSGKSSILQSILLIKQTIEHAPAERVVALNGPLVRFGTFSDILNYDAARDDKEANIGIGWKIVANETHRSSPSNLYLIEDRLDNVCVDFSFDTKGSPSDKETLELQPDLRATHVQALFADSEENVHTLDLEVERATGRGRRLVYQTNALEEGAAVRFKVKDVDQETKDLAEARPPDSKIVGASVSHFLPSSFVIRFDRNRQVASRVAAALTLSGPVRRARIPSIALSQKALKLLADRIGGIGGSARGEELIEILFPGYQATGYTTSPSDAIYQQLSSVTSPSTRRALRESLFPIRGELEELIHKHLGPDKTLSVGRAERLTRTEAHADRFFRFFLRYLGPLRADPRPLYPLQALTSPTDVGPKGELTAAVLHLNAKRKLQTITSKSFLTDPVSFDAASSTLSEAVADWLGYLGIADEVQILEKGKFGHELRVRTHGVSEFQDLTNVGVGVSQVLPIVVTCLLAPPGSTIILEQPELHLHPAVQARLADFFIAMAFLDKQCVIETHSEHFVERMRFRVVQDLGDRVFDKTKMYFFHKDGGNTAIKDVELTRYGAIEDWPTDFFDQSQIENEKIVLKALERHKAEKALNG